MNKFIGGLITGAVVSASAVTAMNMVHKQEKKREKHPANVANMGNIGTALHKLGDMAENIGHK